MRFIPHMKLATYIVVGGLIGGTLGLLFSSIIESPYVSGDKHVYRGQLLHLDELDKKLQDLETLSDRASWLTTTQRLRIEAQEAVEELIAQAEVDGMCIVVMSSYRTFRQQQSIYTSIKDKTLVAQPGSSEHHTGLAVDFTACPMKDGKRDDSIERLELRKDFSELPEYFWLTIHGKDYGFEQSFKENNVEETGYQSEAWHWKYIIN